MGVGGGARGGEGQVDVRSKPGGVAGAYKACGDGAAGDGKEWVAKGDNDIEWVMKQNVKEARLARMDADWVRKWIGRISG